MRVHATAVLASLVFASSAMAQWAPIGGTNDIMNTNSGAVGVNAAPWRGAMLEVNSSASLQYGIWATCTGTTGRAIVGLNSDSSNSSSAIYGLTNSTNGGIAVMAIANGTSGSNLGLYGSTLAPNGVGAKGVHYPSTGFGVGVVAQSNSPDGYAFYGVGARNYFSGNVGIGTTVPTAKLHVNGTARLENLPTASTAPASVVTLDSAGNAAAMAVPFANGMQEWYIDGSWTVPAGVTKVKFQMWGAGGAASVSLYTENGGSGAYGEGILNVSPGQTLNLTVGYPGTTAGGSGSASRISLGSTVLLEAGGGSGGTAGPGSGGTFTQYVSGTFITRDGYMGSEDHSLPTPPPCTGPVTQINGLSGTGVITVYADVGSGGAVNRKGARGCIKLQW